MKATAYIHMTKEGATLNDEAVNRDVFEDSEGLPFTALFKSLGIKYPKYYKMDNLCKLGFLGVELLKSKVDFSAFGDDRIAQILQNSYSSLDTDRVHQDTINRAEKPTSPAVFVYTLPNIVMGEIAIRNTFYGENLFTLANSFSADKFTELCSVQFQLDKADAVIGGWIELYENDFNLRLYFVEKDQSKGAYSII